MLRDYIPLPIEKTLTATSVFVVAIIFIHCNTYRSYRIYTLGYMDGDPPFSRGLSVS